jgi:CelD/BcsL family acetyltransferase involved in cellulose biosynthesis
MVESDSALEAVRAEWDRLAVASRRPYCAPAWQLAWWRHAAPSGALLRAVVVHHGEEVIGVAPFFAVGRRYRLLAAPVSARTVPLAAEGREAAVATAVAGALIGATPRPAVVQFDGVERDSAWPELLGEAWPSRPVELQQETAPVIALEAASYDEWLAGRSGNFRQQMRRRRRKLEELGAEFRLAGADHLEPAIAELERLHFLRRGDRPSDAFGPGVAAMLAETGRELLDANRFRLWTIATESASVSAQLFIEAGGELAFWNGGFDDAYRDSSPGVQAILSAIGDGIELGCDRLELGAGDQDYKLRMASGEDELRSVALVAAGLPGASARLRLGAMRARRALGRAAPEGLKRRLHAIRGPGQ